MLARSKQYSISNEYEVVYLHRPDGQKIVIGDFYGDPAAAIIDWEEKWCVTVGCGLILYWLKEPFRPYEYDRNTVQWSEIYRSPPDEWWIEAVYQVDDNLVRLVVDPQSDHAGVYELDISDMAIRKLIPEEVNA